MLVLKNCIFEMIYMNVSTNIFFGIFLTFFYYQDFYKLLLLHIPHKRESLTPISPKCIFFGFWSKLCKVWNCSKNEFRIIFKMFNTLFLK